MTEEIPTPIIKDDSQLVREAREKLKAENDLLEAEKLRSERLRAEAILGGRSAGAIPVVVETAHDKWAREAKERYKGTGLDPTR